jgi:hypothetical protein
MKFANNKILFFSIFLFFLAFFLFIFSLLLEKSFILDKKEIPTFLEIGDIPAFNLDNSTFSFGKIVSGITSSRSIQIDNNYDFPIAVFLTSRGNISRFLLFEKETDILVNEKRIIDLKTISPAKEDYGNYSGKIILTLKRKI